MERPLIAAVVLAAGCASPPAQPTLVGQQEYVKAMGDSYSAFTWPHSRKPDLAVLAEKCAPSGSERIVLEITNSCAWYLDREDALRRGDRWAAAAALKVMGRCCRVSIQRIRTGSNTLVRRLRKPGKATEDWPRTTWPRTASRFAGSEPGTEKRGVRCGHAGRRPVARPRRQLPSINAAQRHWPE